MALIYEHWRPDTNECFYVGASKIGIERAAKFYRSNDEHIKVVAHLKSLGLAPFYKIIWDDLENDCVDAYEKIRISTQKAILGEKLTNKADGGQGFNINWTAEMRSEMSVKISDLNNKPENLEKNRKTQIVAQNRPEVVAKKSAKAKVVMNLPEVSAKVRSGLLKYFQTPGALEAHGIRMREAHAKIPAEEKSRIAIERQRAIPPEERSAIARRRIQSRTPEELSASARKGAATRAVTETNESKAQRKLSAKIWQASRTAEEKAESLKKGWETRRRKNAELIDKEGKF